jgi:5'-nucleotidase
VRQATAGLLDWSAVEHVVLDMDGTLLDLHFDNQVWNELLPRRYAELHGLAPAEARVRIEDHLAGRRGTLPWYCLDHWERELGIDVAELEAELEHLIDLRAGVREFLAGLAERDLTCILATNAHPRSLARKLARTGIAEGFATVVSAHQLGAAKEDLAFWHALGARTALRPERTLLIDDNHAVLRTAARYGIRYLFGIERPDSRGPRVEFGEYRCLRRFDELG